jgi:hypothetical protein
MANKFVQSFEANAGLALVLKVVIVANLKKIIAVVKYADPDEGAVHLVHNRMGY